MQTRLRELETEPVGRLLWRYSLPAVVGMLVNALYNVVDRIFIGQCVGPEAIAGLAITFPATHISTAIGVLIGAGSSARVSILLGMKDHDGAQRVFGNAFVLTIINALIYLTVFALFMEPIMMAFGASEVTLPYACEYMYALIPGMLLMNMTFGYNNVMRASGYPVKAMVTMLIGTAANLILDPIFIYVFDMGIRGAAIATDISMAITTVFVLIHFCNPQSTVRFARGIYRLKWSVVAGIIAIGAAPALVNACGSIIHVIINKTLYIYGGDNAIAASGIFSTVASLLGLIVIGICQGMQPIVGYNYGAGQTHRLFRAYWMAVGAATVVSTIGFAVCQLWPSVVARAFTVDEQLIATTDTALRYALTMYWMVGFQIVSTNFFQSIGKAAKSVFLSLARQIIFLIPLLLLMPRMWGLNGVWTAFPTADVFATAATAILIFMEFRKLRRGMHQPLPGGVTSEGL